MTMTRGGESRAAEARAEGRANDTWMQTASGRAVDLLAPRPEQISPTDMAEHLAKIPRFVGATPNVCFSVAQHSVIVAEALPVKARPYGILHDGHEYVIGDDASPKLRALEALDPAALAAVGELRRRVDIAIHSAFGLNWPPSLDIAAMVHAADRRALATEKRDHMARAPKPWESLPSPFPRAHAAWPWPMAAERFLETLRRYAPRWPE